MITNSYKIAAIFAGSMLIALLAGCSHSTPPAPPASTTTNGAASATPQNVVNPKHEAIMQAQMEGIKAAAQKH